MSEEAAGASNLQGQACKSWLNAQHQRRDSGHAFNAFEPTVRLAALAAVLHLPHAPVHSSARTLQPCPRLLISSLHNAHTNMPTTATGAMIMPRLNTKNITARLVTAP